MSQPKRPVKTTRTFDKAFKKKPESVQKRIIKTIELLATDFHHPSLQAHRIKGAKGVWEAYVDKARYRVTYELSEQDSIQLLNNCDHSILPKR